MKIAIDTRKQNPLQGQRDPNERPQHTKREERYPHEPPNQWKPVEQSAPR
jgi:hypothetical protein